MFDSVKKGRIDGLGGNWSSGLAKLYIETGDGLITVPCDNGSTVRALNAAFPGFITSNHGFDNQIVKGRPIAYVMDDMGLILGAFSPISDYCMDCGPFKPGCEDCEDKEAQNEL